MTNETLKKAINDGCITASDATKYAESLEINNKLERVIIDINDMLDKYPDENEFGVESYNFDNATGYMYPSFGNYGNMAVYLSRDKLKDIIKDNLITLLTY